METLCCGEETDQEMIRVRAPISIGGDGMSVARLLDDLIS
jgi:hypothetical protein